MEFETPPPPAEQSTVTENKSGIVRRALIVRMPDYLSKEWLRRRVDRLEVDEMIIREETNRGKNRAVTIVSYNSPPHALRLVDGMDVYFVGHGRYLGFAGPPNVDENALAAWIKARATQLPVRLGKIKLVTCNGGLPYGQTDDMLDITFAARLAAALQDIATGRVVAFNGFLLSAPNVKATYGIEPDLANFEKNKAAPKFSDKEKELRMSMIRWLIQKICKQGGKPSNDGIEWAKKVFCKDPDGFEKTARMLTEPAMLPWLKGDIKGSHDSILCWPDLRKGEDLETMIRGMKQRNASTNVVPISQEAATQFKAWKLELQNIIQDAWNWRKNQITLAYAAEKDPRAFEIKGLGQRMKSRQEVNIPE